MKDYIVIYDRSSGPDIAEALNSAARDGYRLHSVVPGAQINTNEWLWPGYVMERDNAVRMVWTMPPAVNDEKGTPDLSDAGGSKA